MIKDFQKAGNNDIDNQVHYLKSNGIKLLKPTINIIVNFPEGISEEDINKIIAEFEKIIKQ